MLSIVIPARDEEKAIGDTVLQFAPLTTPHEVIVSDDDSKDGTVAAAQGAGARVVTYSGDRHTPGRTRNAGAKVAQGEFIAFIDADVSVPDVETFFRRALAHFEHNPKLAGVCGPQRARHDIETWADRISFGILNTTLFLQNNVFHRGEASGKIMVVRKTAFDAVNGFREDIATREDGDFFNRLAKVGPTLFDSSLMIYHGARRAHHVGWARLWYIWLSNSIYFAVFNKTIAEDWKPVR